MSELSSEPKTIKTPINIEVDTVTIAKFGQTGTGKTSLSNALFGVNWCTDYAVACTQTVSKYKGKMLPEISQGKDFTWQLCDTPGVGESEYADDQHFEDIYHTFHQADVIMWVVQADTRAFAEDQKAILKLTDKKQKIPNAHYVIVLNQIDRVHPENWDSEKKQPSPEQLALIPEKIDIVYQRFSPYLPIQIEHIIPCSVVNNYGLDNLVNTINKFNYLVNTNNNLN
ncbi:MAG: GTPase [Sphaerospermopsis sp.]|uniref:GTPase family protein n=1 Tax=Sphaerospermopsis sp. LEGE 08334 TaxID=1828651 RepID=UPI0018821506|nr:GTPase [Sphaerospermopsis sp. LEGE 08334]MBE9059241.1 50S ribosome-binding GTPase [Sphaerospermopsis sp. LEGE 08334]MEB3151013.1 GTPase [Sphaerospermopsis sp.]